jgi:cyclic beta-1,2-glucan synthetase
LEWLRDNYYLIEREGHSALRDLRGLCLNRARSQSFNRVILFCSAQSGQGTLPGQDIFFDAFARITPNAQEVTWLPLALRLTLLECAGKSLSAPQDIGVKMLSGAVNAFRALPDWDFTRGLEEINPLEKKLRQDPAGVYPRMDDASRATYRTLAQRSAKKEKTSAEAVTDRLLREAAGETEAARRHIGTKLLEHARHTKRGKCLLVLETILPILIPI